MRLGDILDRVYYHVKYYGYRILNALFPKKSFRMKKKSFRMKVSQYRALAIKGKISPGPLNPDKTFYVIRRLPPGSGFFSNFHHVMLHIMIAQKRKMIPVVDMENYETFYNEGAPVNGSMNAWEYFFEQPEGFKLSEVYMSKNVVLSGVDYPCTMDIFDSSYFDDPRKIRDSFDLINRYMKFNKFTNDYIEEVWNLIQNRTEILAVMSRGTDYKGASQHHIQPQPALLLEKTKEIMLKHKIKYCFLKTEEKAAFDLFKREFGDKLLSYDRTYYDEYNALENGRRSSVPEYLRGKKDSLYRETLEYIGGVVVASRCDYLLTGINNGSVAAIEFNGGRYKEKYIIDLGKYA